ncbi:hypothetical protein SM418_12550 [Actinomadura chokoriensis]
MVRTEESGLEEWACPTCGRRILLHWPPHYVKHVLDTGDEQACHIARTAEDTPGGPSGNHETAAAREKRWLRETGTHALTPHARPRFNPSEPV